MAEFLAWWIDQETDFRSPERAGVLRYYLRVSDDIVWADRPEDLRAICRGRKIFRGGSTRRDQSVSPLSRGRVFDNPALLRVNPDYVASLLSLPLVERARLLRHRKIRPAAGLYFKREWCAVVDEVPADLDMVRYWDLAATEKTALQRPGLDGRRQARRRSEWRLLAVGCGAPAGQPWRCREAVARYCHAGRQTGQHWVWPGSGASGQEPGASSRARLQRLYRDTGGRKRRQADTVWAV